MASSKPTPAARPYLSNGEVLSAPPFTARARNFVDHAYNTVGLYFASLFTVRSLLEPSVESSVANILMIYSLIHTPQPKHHNSISTIDPLA